MKKILILILFILTFRNYSQTLDTSKFALERELLQGYYSYVINKSEYFGYGAGQIKFPLTFDLNSIDTANWRLIRNWNSGLYDKAENKTDWFGYPAGSVRANLFINTEVKEEKESLYTNYSFDCTYPQSIVAEEKLIGISVVNYDGTSAQSVLISNSQIKSNSVIVVNCDIADVFNFNQILYSIIFSEGVMNLYFKSTQETSISNLTFYIAIIN